MKTRPEEIERLPEFLTLDENGLGFVAIGWPGIGDLTDCSRDEIRGRLEREYRYRNPRHLGYDLGVVNGFVNTMNPDDIVLIRDGENVWIGILGVYHYEPERDYKGGMPHQRKVKWVASVPKRELNEKVQLFIANRNTVSQFPHPNEETGLDAIISHGGNRLQPSIVLRSTREFAPSVIDKAKTTLEEYLSSPDENLRIRAAIAILELSKTR